MRSIYGKFLLSVTAIIVVGFVLLAVILSAEARVYSDGLFAESVRNAAFSVRRTYWNINTEDTEDQTFVGFVDAINIDTAKYAIFADGMILLLADQDGSLLCEPIAAPDTDVSDVATLPQELLAAAAKDGIAITETGVAFPNETAYLLPVTRQGTVEGYLVTTMQGTSLADYTNTTITTIVVTSLMITLATLIAFLILSSRTISPLRRIGHAARQFAQGQRDVRVPETGGGELADLARSFNLMADSLAKTEEMRRSFLSNVSHDLRTPMTVIAGFVDGILDGTIPKDKHEYYLRIISSEVKRLSRLVKALLDISRIQAGERKFKPEYFDICEMARQILISFEQMIDNKHLEVEFDIDKDSMVAYADVDAIHQVFYNICDNAVKFSREGGLLRVSVKSIEKKIHVFVYNEGSGIPEEDIPYVFERFYKTDKSRSLDRTGVGLGLFIARSVIEAHGEKIEVRSVQNEYCEFEFTLREGKEQRTRTLDLKPLQ